MKKLYLFILFLGFTKISMGQNPYYDAQYLRKFYMNGIIASTNDSDDPEEKIKWRDTTISDPIIQRRLNYIDSLEQDTILAILRNYYGFETNGNYTLINKKIKGGRSKSIIKLADNETKSSSGDPIQLSTNFTSSVSGINITNLADGIAIFLVERFKQELNIAFFQKFKDDLTNPKFNDLKILYPETWKTLLTIGDDIYQFNLYINVLRQSFAEDLSDQFTNIATLLNQPTYRHYLTEVRPDLGTMVYSSLYIVNQLTIGSHPGEIFENFEANKYIHLVPESKKNDTALIYLDSNIINGIEASQLISWSLRSKSNKTYWVPADSVESMIKDPITFSLYLELLRAKSSGIAFYSAQKTISLTGVIDDALSAENNLIQIKSLIKAVSQELDEINIYITEVKNTPVSSRNIESYEQLFNASLDLLSLSKKLVALPILDLGTNLEKDFDGFIDQIVYVAQTGANLCLDAKEKNYTAVVINTISLLDTILNYKEAFNLTAMKKDFESQVKQLKNNDYGPFTKEVRNIIDQVDKKDIPVNNISDINAHINQLLTPISEPTMKNKIYNDIYKLYLSKYEKYIAENKGQMRALLLKYGAFMAAVVEAKNSDDVKNAIQSVALPPGSYSIKRKCNFNISLNGYMGGGRDFGNPFIKNVYADSLRNYYNLNWNISAPVGVAFSSGLKYPKYKCGSLTGFVSLIDVGSLAAYHLNGDTSVLSRKIMLGDIFSPGLSLIWGIPKYPLSLSAGCVYKPSLYYDKLNSDLMKVPGMLRWNVSLLIDIPIFNFYTSGN